MVDPSMHDGYKWNCDQGKEENKKETDFFFLFLLFSHLHALFVSDTLYPLSVTYQSSNKSAKLKALPAEYQARQLQAW